MCVFDIATIKYDELESLRKKGKIYLLIILIEPN